MEQTCICLGIQRMAGSRHGSSADLLAASAAHHMSTACSMHSIRSDSAMCTACLKYSGSFTALPY